MDVCLFLNTHTACQHFGLFALMRSIDGYIIHQLIDVLAYLLMY